MVWDKTVSNLCTLEAETFARRKFGDFRVFWHFLRKFLPRHNLNSKFAKVSAREIIEILDSRNFFYPIFFVSSSFCVAVLNHPNLYSLGL